MTTFVEFQAAAIHLNYEVLIAGRRYGDPVSQVTAMVTNVERGTPEFVELTFDNGAKRRLRFDDPVYVVIRPGVYERLGGQCRPSSMKPKPANWAPPDPTNAVPAPFIEKDRASALEPPTPSSAPESPRCVAARPASFSALL